MNRPTLLLLPLLLAGAAAVAQTAQAQLVPPADRISDEAISGDQAVYEAMQRRIKALNDTGRWPVRDYALSKAQCWLDASFHEYARNDRSAFPQAALDESAKLVVAMETRPAADALALARETPLVNGAARLRSDLWDAASALKGASGFACAAQQTACAEVELVHAGNEYNQQQWRHAKPYVQIAEDLIGEARVAAERCGTAPVVPVAPPVAPAQRVAVAAELVFAFDRSDIGDLRPASRAQLDALLERLRREGLAVESVRLAGHADRLNGTGDAGYNQRLSERRVRAVRDHLVARGIDAARISTAAKGDREPVLACAGPRLASRPELAECLLPNRRVEIVVDAVRGR